MLDKFVPLVLQNYQFVFRMEWILLAIVYEIYVFAVISINGLTLKHDKSNPRCLMYIKPHLPNSHMGCFVKGLYVLFGLCLFVCVFRCCVFGCF